MGALVVLVGLSALQIAIAGKNACILKSLQDGKHISKCLP